ncbi:uncharacterized protein LOC142231564 [Haematobia irritans]|uniref:uncharacterized protein LOC142231564 n=1 Tax=Haematobia irritans TaxID=7368 RepID=UPI003F50A8AB
MTSLRSRKRKELTCQLCFNVCTGRHRDLYEKNGQRTEIHMVTAKYFNSAWLINEHNVNGGVICVACWRNIYEFDMFQECIVRKHMRLDLFQRTIQSLYNPQTSTNTSGLISYGVPYQVPMHMPNQNDLRRLGANNDITNSFNLSNRAIENVGEPIEIDSNVSDQSSIEVQSMQNENLCFIPNDKMEIEETSLNLPYEGNEPQGDHPIENSMMPQNNEQIVKSSNPIGPPNAIQSSVTQTSHLVGMISMQNDNNISSDLSSEENSLDSSAESEDFDESVGIFIGGEFDKPVEQNQSELRSQESKEDIKSDNEVSKEATQQHLPPGENSKCYKDTNAREIDKRKLKQLKVGNLNESLDFNDARSFSFSDLERGENSDDGISEEETTPKEPITNGPKHSLTTAAIDSDGSNAFSISDSESSQSSEDEMSEKEFEQIRGETSKSKKMVNVSKTTIGANGNYPISESDTILDRRILERETYEQQLLDPVQISRFPPEGNCQSTWKELAPNDTEFAGEPIKRPRRKRNRISYRNKLKVLQTVEDYDEYIAQWRPQLECIICHENVTKFTLLLEHYKDQHPEEQCHIECCNEKFFYRYEIEKHIHYHSDHLGAYKCEICFKCYSNTYELKKHLKIKHAGLRYVCSKCGKGFMTKRAMSIHMKLPCNKDENEKNLLRTHTCKDCGKSYKTKRILHLHYKNVHMGDRKIFTCPICDKPMYTLIDFNIHKTVHSVVRDRKFSCEFCSKKYLHRRDKYIHLKNAHPKEWNKRQEARIEKCNSIQIYKCQTCEKVYKTPWALHEHKKAVHGGEVTFKCTLCPKTYRYSSNVAAHFKRVHFEEWKNKQKTKINL